MRWEIMTLVTDFFFSSPFTSYLFFFLLVEAAKEQMTERKETDTFKLNFYFWFERLICGENVFLNQ